MLRFPYGSEPVRVVPPTLPPGSNYRWRPLVPVRIYGSAGQHRDYARALLDNGADDTVFPLNVARSIGVTLASGGGFNLRWRGQSHPLTFGAVDIELTDASGSAFRWPAMIAFSPAPIRYPLLGQGGCLNYFDARFLGADRVVELDPNRAYPGRVV